MKKQSMFENYPDVVEVEDLRKMLGGIMALSTVRKKCWSCLMRWKAIPLNCA